MQGSEKLIERFIEAIISQRGSSKNTVSSYEADLYAFKKQIKNKTLTEVCKKDIVFYIETMRNQGLSSKTESRRLAAIRQFYAFLTEEEVITENPSLSLDNPKSYKSLPRCISQDEVLQLFSATNELKYEERIRAQVLLHLLYGSGLRVSEALGLRFNMFDDGGKFVRVLGKGGKERLVGLSDDGYCLVQELKTCNIGQSDDWLFPSVNKKKHISRQRIFQILRFLAIEGGVNPKSVSPHVMRHAFATHLIDNGADLLSVKKMLGHSSITTTEIYTHISNTKIKKELFEKHPLQKNK